MKVVAVDPDPMELVRLSESIRSTTPVGTSVECFRDPLFAYQFARHNHVDTLYAVAEMKRLSGFGMAKMLRQEYPRLQVYFIWSNDDFRMDAIRAGADGYLIRPVTPDSLRRLEVECKDREDERAENGEGDDMDG